MPVIPDKPSAQTDVGDDHDAEPKLEVGDLLFSDIKFRPKSTGKELIKSTTYGTPEFRVFPTSVNRGLWRGALEHAVGLTYTSLHLMGARTKDRGKLISLAATAFPTFYPWIQGLDSSTFSQ